MPVALATLALILAGALAPAEPDWGRAHAEAQDLLQQYIRINTSNPPGDVRKAADFLTRIFEREDLKVTRYESAPGKVIVYARLKGSGAAKPILLLHHMDVVPADPARWKVDPFSAELRGGDVWGRGAVDMKGLGVAHVVAFLSLKRQNAPLARDVILMAVPDEEVGGQLGARWMLERHWPELDAEFILDEGGFGSRDLYAAGKLVYGISVAEKKVLWLRVRSEGVAGHGSQPHAANPNDRLVRGLTKLLSQPLPTAPFAVLDTLRAKVGPLAQNKFTNAIQHSTISLTTLRSGVGDPPKVNVIPSVAEATLDCRVLPGTSRDAWVAEIRKRLGDPELKVEVIYEGEDPTVTSQDSPLYRALEAAARRESPHAIVSPIIVPFGTDSNAYRPRGVKSYGFFPAILTAEIAASMHGDAERIPIDEVVRAARVLYHALSEAAGRR